MEGVEFGEDEGGIDFGAAEEAVVEEKSLIKKIWKDPKKRIYAIIGLLLLSLLLFDGEPEAESELKKKEEVKKVEKKKNKVIQFDFDNYIFKEEIIRDLFSKGYEVQNMKYKEMYEIYLQNGFISSL